MILTALLCVITGLAVGALAGFTYHKSIETKKFKGALSESERIISEATKEAEQAKRDLISEGKEETHRMRQDLERETKERRNELQRSERRLEQKEENLDKKIENISRKEEELRERHDQAQAKLNELAEREQELISKLEQIAQLTREEARDILLAEVESDANHLIGLRLKELEERAKREADKKAQEILQKTKEQKETNPLWERTSFASLLHV